MLNSEIVKIVESDIKEEETENTPPLLRVV